MLVASGLIAEYVGKWAKNGNAPGNNADPTSTWKDLAGSHDGTLTGFTFGTPWSGSGTNLDPYVLAFDGNNDYVGAFDLSAAESRVFTYEAWVKYTTAISGLNIFSEGGSSTSNPFTQLNAGVSTDGYLRFQLRNDAGAAANVASPLQYNDGNWHHVVGTTDGTTMRLYVDGGEVGTPATTPAGPFTINQGRIGAQGYTTPSFYWGGSIATVRVYNRALSAAEVAQNYAAGPCASVAQDASSLIASGIS